MTKREFYLEQKFGYQDKIVVIEDTHTYTTYDDDAALIIRHADENLTFSSGFEFVNGKKKEVTELEITKERFGKITAIAERIGKRVEVFRKASYDKEDPFKDTDKARASLYRIADNLTAIAHILDKEMDRDESNTFHMGESFIKECKEIDALVAKLNRDFIREYSFTRKY